MEPVVDPAHFRSGECRDDEDISSIVVLRAVSDGVDVIVVIVGAVIGGFLAGMTGFRPAEA
jgi:hypothetical protein